MDRHHPYWKRDHMFKYTYCFGLGVMSMGHMKSITETQDYFYEIMEAICLPKEEWKQIFDDLNNRFEEWIDRVFLLLGGRQEQYCFLLDLYSILKRTCWAKEYCREILNDYLQVFQLSDAEKIFFENFYDAMQSADLEKAVQAVNVMNDNGYYIRYDFLTWFYPGFYMEEKRTGIRVRDGETVVLDRPVSIIGDIEVDKGGSLLIQGADIKMDGRIIVHGGRFQIDHGHVEIVKCKGDYWLSLEGTAVVVMTDTAIDCGFQCGVVWQTSGRLMIRDCWFRRSASGRMIHFSGRTIRIMDSHFSEAKAGTVRLEGTSRGIIEGCDFQDSYAEYGGAIYSDTIHDVLIQRCTFERCEARYLAAAVYFKYQKLGQQVTDCNCMACNPVQDPFFNVVS